MFGYRVWLNGKLITEECLIYDSYERAESEAGFAVNCYADSLDVHWSEFEIEVTRE